MLVFVAFGSLVFLVADHQSVMVPSQEKRKNVATETVPATAPSPTPLGKQSCDGSYPCLNPFIYSLDAFLPIIELHQEKYWLPDPSRPGGRYVLWYLWFHICMGWLFTSLLAAALTGLVKKD